MRKIYPYHCVGVIDHEVYTGIQPYDAIRFSSVIACDQPGKPHREIFTAHHLLVIKPTNDEMN